ncbi:MAG: FkbM family methyltransferase [Deltaproteobacteria bacterium]
MDRSLIIDVGMHVGRDTEFYLKKGFRVVAVEADPRHVEAVQARLRSYIDDGHLTILNVAINTFDGETDFFVNPEHDDWGTVSPEFVRRNVEVYGSRHETVKVRCTRFENVLNEFGVPYYLKVDIEGLDDLCLEALDGFDTAPRFVSIEPDQKSFEGAFNELSMLWRLGYRAFKIVNQGRNRELRCPDPPREGVYVEQRFDGASSGLFGEESPGPWRGIEDTVVAWRSILAQQRRFGDQGGWEGEWRGTLAHKLYERYRRVRKQGPLGWYDFHARHLDPAGRRSNVTSA